MFSKPRPNESVPQPSESPELSTAAPTPQGELRSGPAVPASAPKKPKPAASVLSSDITITGNVHSSGDIQIEGTVEGDVRAQVLIVGETATVKGEVIAEEVIAHGRVIGRLRGVKVRLSSTARVEGDIVHKAIAIESGAHFEGSVQRQDDPVGQRSSPQPQSQPQPQPTNLAPLPSKSQAQAS
jgi:cytoskeletal protein CcmA (bactofilin family)